jgi:hypothetical protein
VIPAVGYAEYGSHVDLTLRGNGGAELASGIISLILWVGSLLIFVLFAVGVGVTSLLRHRAGTLNR